MNQTLVIYYMLIVHLIMQDILSIFTSELRENFPSLQIYRKQQTSRSESLKVISRRRLILNASA